MGFRKRGSKVPRDRSKASAFLRESSTLVDAGRFSEALIRLDNLASTGGVDRSRIAIQVARIHERKGRFSEASESFRRAEQLSGNDAAWFSAALGNIRARLKSADVFGAETAADEVDNKSRILWEARFNSLIASQLAGGASVVAPPRPHRPSVVLHRLGEQFWEQGEAGLAAKYFRRSLVVEPNGASRSRISLARIELLSGRADSAFELASQGLRIGNYMAKTVSAWSILVAAAVALGKPEAIKPIAAGLQRSRGWVRARASLTLVRALRDHGVSFWSEYATIRPEDDRNGAVTAEFSKMLLASVLRSGSSPSEIISSALKHLEIPSLSPKEWMAGAKVLVAARVNAAQDPRTNDLLRQGTKRFGNNTTAEVTLALGHACLGAGLTAAGVKLLEGINKSAPEISRRARWTLAQTYARIGNTEQAMKLFDAAAKDSGNPARFQVLARIEWLRVAVQSADDAALNSCKEEILRALSGVSDFELLMDVARQMSLAPGELATSALKVFSRGEQKALDAFETTENPDRAATILFKLYRRRSDFGLYKAIVDHWNGLGDVKRQWLWSKASDYWEIVGLVAGAYRLLERADSASKLVADVITDASTPPAGIAIVGVPEALAAANSGDKRRAESLFAMVLENAPSQPLCGYGYYYRAIIAVQAGDTLEAKSWASRIRQVIGAKTGLGWQRDLLARSALIEADLDVAAATSRSGMPTKVLSQQAAVITEHGRIW